MDKLIHIILLGAFCICGKLSAQTSDYYTGKDTISGDGFAYKATKLDGHISLENIQNTWFQKENFYEYINKEVAPEKLFHVNGYAKILNQEAITDLFKTIINKQELDGFKQAHNPMRGKGIPIFFCSDLDGNILEVKFLISTNDPTLLSFPPDKLYQYEQLLKKHIKYKVADSMRGFATFAKEVRNMFFYHNL